MSDLQPIDMFTIPSIKDKSTKEALDILHKFMRDTAMQVMALNKELRKLKDQVGK